MNELMNLWFLNYVGNCLNQLRGCQFVTKVTGLCTKHCISQEHRRRNACLTLSTFHLPNSVAESPYTWCCTCRQWRTEGGGGVGLGVQTPPPRNSEGPPKSCQTQPDCEKFKKLLNLGCQHPKMFGKKGSKILKLPPVHNFLYFQRQINWLSS